MLSASAKVWHASSMTTAIRALAVHETAHAVVGHLLGATILNVTLNAKLRDGTTVIAQGFAPQKWGESVLMALAGGTAQRMVEPGRSMLDDPHHPDWANDTEKAEMLYSSRVGVIGTEGASDVEEDRLFAELECAAHRATAAALCTSELWLIIEAVADRLINNCCRLSGEELARTTDAMPTERARVALKAAACSLNNYRPNT